MINRSGSDNCEKSININGVTWKYCPIGAYVLQDLYYEIWMMVNNTFPTIRFYTNHNTLPRKVLVFDILLSDKKYKAFNEHLIFLMSEQTLKPYETDNLIYDHHPVSPHTVRIKIYELLEGFSGKGYQLV